MAQTQRLQFIIDAENKADGVLKSVSSGLGKLSNTVDDLQPAFKKMAAVGTAAFAGISAIAISSFKASADAAAQNDISLNRMRTTLEGLSATQFETATSFVKSAKSIDWALNDTIAGAMENVGKAAVQMAFDDEEAVSSFSKLFQVTGDLDGSMKEVNLAMDLARSSGQSLESATDALIKVHAGGTRVLKDFGITVEEGTTATEALKIIQEKTAGSAKTFADSTAGGMARLQVEIGNLQESIGDALAPAFGKAFAAVEPLVTKFGDWAEKNPDLLAKILLIGGAVAALAVGIGALGMALPPIITAFTILTGPIGLVIAAIGLLIAAGVAIYKNWDEIKLGALVVWESIRDTITTVMTAVSEFVTIAWEGIKEAFWTYINFITGAVATFLDYFAPGWQETLQKIWNITVVIFTALGNYIKTWLNNVKVGWEIAWNGIKDLFLLVWDRIKIGFGVVADWLKEKIDGLTGPFQKFIDLAKEVLSFASSASSAIGGAVSSGFNAVVNRGSSITGRAIGGPMTAGRPYIVGENGPELFTPNSFGRMSTAAATAGMGSTVINISGNTFMGSEDIAERIGDDILRVLKRNIKL